MELLQLKYFCDAAETENFSKTAKKFLVPPSNISQSIKRLEKELEIKLFVRSANKISLSEAGNEFYKKINLALNTIEQAKKAVCNNIPKTIKINIHINRRIVMSAIEKFQKKYPDVHFITSHNHAKNNIDYDIIITDNEFDASFIKKKAACEDFVLAFNNKFFEIPESLSIEEIEKYPFISMPEGTSIHENTYKICADLGFTPNIALQSEDPFYIRKCIELGLGVAIIPELSWRGQFSNDVSLNKIGNYKRNIYVYRKDYTEDYIDEFCNVLIKEFNL